MKLNLWLIANQLSQYDIETRISAATERTISGPLPVAAAGSVYVRNEGADVICHAEQGTIVIHDMEEKEGFLLIQSIFNWYDSWQENIEEALRAADYRLFVHLCAQAFSNPVLLQDSNYLLLGMDCRGISIGNIPEWRYIYEKEQSSVTYYLAMSDALKNPVRKYNDCVYRFNTSAKDEEGNEYQTSGLHVKFRYLARDYGQITVLDKKRPLNPGDVALLNLLTEKCSLIFAAAERGDDSGVNKQIMNDLLEYKEVPKEQMDYHYSIIIRKSPDSDNRLCLFLFHFDSAKERTAGLELLKNILTKQYPAIYNWIYREDLLVIAYVPEPNILVRQMYSWIGSQGYLKKLRVGVSLPFDEISNLPYYYEQAIFAINHIDSPGLCFFYDCACEYLMENMDRQRKLLACEPICLKMWTEEPDKREFLRTLSVYLGLERATGLAADYLSIHRNTINYRIKYVKEQAGWDYEDPSLRNYLRLSIYYLTRWGEL
ncbi:MAG: PucR family transcriptional regulator [Lachnospiraceae bacterium]|nr:PucR family transcriptional regulator [Lachnospiraceae bacterium]